MVVVTARGRMVEGAMAQAGSVREEAVGMDQVRLEWAAVVVMAQAKEVGRRVVAGSAAVRKEAAA